MFDENLETLKGVIAKMSAEPRENRLERQRLIDAWDNLITHTLIFVDNSEQFANLANLVRVGNKKAKLSFLTKARELGIQPFSWMYE